MYSSDLRIRVMSTGLAAYPDVTIVCGPAQADPESRTTVINPMVIVEVLSDSTHDYDCGEKAEHYREIPSLQACVLVSHRRPHIDVWQRGSDGGWSLAEYGPGDTIELAVIGMTLPVDRVYRGVLDTAR